MLDGRRVLGVVPARGGSKGIRLKNLRRVGGVPLVARVGEIARQVPLIDRVVVSTDHEDIARAAMEAGIDAPFRRPERLSGDRIGDHDVLVHALEATEADDDAFYDVIVMLQPTSPLRTASDVSGTIEKLVKEAWDAVWTVSPTDSKSHPLKQLKITDQGLDYWDARGAGIIARQQLQPVYHRNGVAYAITRSCLLDQGTIKGRKTGAYVTDGDQVSIDTEWDISLVELILAQREGSS